MLIEGTFLSVLDDGDNLYMHDSAVTLKSLFIIYHSVLRFITVGYNIRHCNLCVKVGWHSLSFDVRPYRTHSNDQMMLQAPAAFTEL